MERKLQERMVGAAVLIVALVVLGPMVLDGGPEDAVEVDVPGQRGDELRTHTFQLDRAPAAQPALSGARRIPEAPMPAAGVVSAPPATTLPPASADMTIADKAPVEKASPVEAAEPAVPPIPTVESPKGAPVRTVASAAPAPTAPKAATAAAPASGAWVVQVGTFGQKDNADRLVTKLKAGGFAAMVSPAARDGKTLFRVRVGPAGSRDAAAEIARRLADAGQAGQVVPQ